MNDTNALLPDIKLRFNIEHPSFEECYADGYVYGRAEISEEANPYHLDSKESEQWLDGWWAGFYGEEPLYDLSDYIKKEASVVLPEASNDQVYHEDNGFLIKVMELSSVIAASAIIGYQLIDLVA